MLGWSIASAALRAGVAAAASERIRQPCMRARRRPPMLPAHPVGSAHVRFDLPSAPRASAPLLAAARRHAPPAAEPAVPGADRRARLGLGCTAARPALQDKTVLVLDLRGPVVEQCSGSWRDSALEAVRGETERPGAAARRARRARRRRQGPEDHAGAADARRVRTAPAWPTLREIAVALERFKAAGKPVVAWGSRFDQRQYYLAAHANEVLLHPMGMVLARRLRPLPQLLPRRARQARRHGQPDARRHLQELRRALHRQRPVAGRARGRKRCCTAACGRSYTDDVEQARQLPPGSVDARHRRAAAAPGGRRRRPGAAGAAATSWSTR